MKTKTLQSAYLTFVLISGVAGAALSLAVTTGSLDLVTALKLFMGFFSLSFPVLLPFLFIWWAKVDEAVKEAHKWAWFWGGSLGMMLAIWIATINLFMQGQLLMPLLVSRGLEAYGFEIGVIATVLLMAYSYIGAWAIWWARHR
jgi:hypothetical protein